MTRPGTGALRHRISGASRRGSTGLRRLGGKGQMTARVQVEGRMVKYSDAGRSNIDQKVFKG